MARRLERDEGLAPVGPFGTGFRIRPQYISRARILHASKKVNRRDIVWVHAEIGAESADRCRGVVLASMFSSTLRQSPHLPAGRAHAVG